MRDACAADDPWQGYRQKFRVFFREAGKPDDRGRNAEATAAQRLGVPDHRV